MVASRRVGGVLEEFINGAPVNLLDATDGAHRHPFEQEGENLDAFVGWQLVGHNSSSEVGYCQSVYNIS